jgi:hypothetical protein
MAYLLRTTPPNQLSRSTKTFDNLIIKSITNIIPYSLNTHSLKQIKLNLSNGGLGLRNTTNHHCAAYLSSLLGSIISLNDLLKIKLILIPQHISSTTILITNLIAPNQLQRDSTNNNKQSFFSNQIEAHQLEFLLSESDEINRARLLATAMPRASAFLEAVPNSYLGLKFDNNEWNAAVAYRLGLQIFARPFQCPMPSCNMEMDIFGRHAVKCAMAGCRTKRHNDIVKLIFGKCQNAALSPLYEPKNVLRNSNERPADWGIPNYPHDGIFSAYDLAITDPTQSKYIKNSSVIPGYAANDYAVNVKIANYSSALKNRNDINFVPMIIETYGGWGNNASSFFNMISRRISQRQFGNEPTFISSYIYQQISVKLQRANANMILKRSSTNLSATNSGSL